MIDATLRSYATRSAIAAALALGLAVPVGFWGGSQADPAVRTGTVSGFAQVVDGDTITVAGTKVRLEGIDAPEKDQLCARADGRNWPCGVVATRELMIMVRGRRVSCDNHGVDKYGRVLGICTADGVNLNAEMVRRGLAWAFVKYSTAFVKEEAEARTAKAGVWQAPTPPPWEHRGRLWSAAQQTAPNGCAIKGNITRNGKIYHNPSSPWYGKISIETGKGERWFCSEAEAEAAGWRPAQQS